LEAGDYFQVLFEVEQNSLENYFLIQRGFEFDDYEQPDPCYIESDDGRFCGHLDIAKAELDRNRFYLKLMDRESGDLEITFDIADKNYQEVKRFLEIIFSGFNTLEIKS
jgi:hypothetical protein